MYCLKCLFRLVKFDLIFYEFNKTNNDDILYFLGRKYVLVLGLMGSSRRCCDQNDEGNEEDPRRFIFEGSIRILEY